MFCVYLSYSFSNENYKKFCVKCGLHNGVQNCIFNCIDREKEEEEDEQQK